IYLLIQFLEKRQQADIGLLEREESSVEDQLKSESIVINDLPTETYEESYISVQPYLFTDSDLKQLGNQSEQNSVVANKSLIMSQFKDPIPIKKNSSESDLEKILDETVLFAEDYTFWNWNEQANILVFFQNDGDRPIYFNQNGLILFFLDDNNEAVFYTQTYLGDTEQHDDKRDLITPLKAIEILYKQNELSPGDEITSVNIGFHTRVPLESGVQVFAPIWKVNVNDEKNYFVNAIEGVVFSNDEHDFLKESITQNLERVHMIKDQEVMKATIENMLKNKLE